MWTHGGDVPRMTTRPAPRRLRRRALALGLVAGAAGLALPATGAAAETATFRLLGAAPMLSSSVTITRADGTTAQVRPGRYHYRITRGTETLTTSGQCVDTAHYIVSGRDYQVSLQTADDAPELGTAAWREAAWLVARGENLIAAAADPQREAAALQVAVWQLTGQVRDGAAPTSDPGLNARAAALRGEAAGRRLPDALDVDVLGTQGCADAPARVRVTGTPGAQVDLSASPSAAEIAPARVTLDATGTAEAFLTTRDGPGGVTVHATMEAPEAVRATKQAGASAPQDQLLVRPRTLQDEDLHLFADCDLYELAPPPLAPEPVPAPPHPDPAPPAPAMAPLALAVQGPPVATPGGEALLRVRVVNRGRATARGVRVQARTPAGLLPRAAAGPAGTRARRTATGAAWTLPPLAPGRGVVVTLRVAVGAGAAGDLARTRVRVQGRGVRATVRAATPVVTPVTPADQGF